MTTISPIARHFEHAVDRLFDTSPFMKDFDRVFDVLNVGTSYPFYNIAMLDNGFEIEIATAGFGKDELKVSFMDSILTVAGERKEEEKTYKKHGISSKSFVRKFPVSDYLYEVADVTYENGILRITFAMKEKQNDIKYLEIK